MKILRLALTFALAAMMISAAHAQPPTLLWSDGVDTADIAVSKDGQYVAVATPSQVRFYSRSSGTPLWTWSSGAFFSVAISEHGDYVAAGGYVGDDDYYVFYWKNAWALTETPDPDWTSNDLYGPIEERCLDMSDDGNYVVAGGTGANIFYWANAKSKEGTDVAPTWTALLQGLVEAVDLSDDGDYVVAGFGDDVAYFKNARTRAGWQTADWISTEPNGPVTDVAVSDDGNFVAASGMLAGGAVYYWAGARSLIEDPPTSWNADFPETVEFLSVDMSCDGDSVVAGAETGNLVYFWSGSRTLTGKPQNPSWTYATAGDVVDVAINDAGTYMAAIDDTGAGTVWFFDKQGPDPDPLWSYAFPGDKLSMSCNGGTLAAGTPAPITALLLDTGYSDPCCGVGVGGVVATVDKSTLLAPYLALLVLIGGAGIASLFSAKKKRSD
jgi:WD40 repeat protein